MSIETIAFIGLFGIAVADQPATKYSCAAVAIAAIIAIVYRGIV